MWGRRRVGKTLLLLEFARGKRHLYFEATSGTRADQLADFSDRLAEATGRAALAVPDWRVALDAVADWAQEGPVLLVLDEFQFIGRTNGGHRLDHQRLVARTWRAAAHLPRAVG